MPPTLPLGRPPGRAGEEVREERQADGHLRAVGLPIRVRRVQQQAGAAIGRGGGGGGGGDAIIGGYLTGSLGGLGAGQRCWESAKTRKGMLLHNRPMGGGGISFES